MARQPAKVPHVDADGMLGKMVEKVGELFEGLRSTNASVESIDARLGAVEKHLAARPTFTPAALQRASGMLDKMTLGKK